MHSASGTCALLTDSAANCPPQANSCGTCPHYQPPGAPQPRRLSLELRLERAAHVRARLYDTLAAAPGGLTSEEVARRARINANTVRGRLSELETAGIVRRLHVRRRTTSGRRAALYEVRS